MKRIRLLTLMTFFCLASIGIFQTGDLSAETLRLMIWEGYFPAQYHSQFQDLVKKKYGVDLKFEISFITDPDQFYDLLRKKELDVITPTHNLLKDERYNFIKKRILIPIDLNNVPNYQNLVSGLKSIDYHSENGKMYAMPYANGSYGLAYNTNLVKEPPTSWNALLEPKYAGKYSLVEDYSEVNVYIAALMAGIKADKLTSYEAVNTPEVTSILKKLRQQTGGYWNGVDKASDLKGKLLATSWGFSFSDLASQGEVWKFANPKEGSPWWVDNFAISWTLSDKPQLKKIAEELINFVISPQFQLDNVVNNLSASPVNLKTPLSTKQRADFHLDDDSETFQKRRIFWPTLTKRTRNGFSILWKNAEK
ncbi:extracellular solute-binding protein [bacterium]|nr:extracellular solute-binding protein [bacterium]